MEKHLVTIIFYTVFVASDREFFVPFNTLSLMASNIALQMQVGNKIALYLNINANGKTEIKRIKNQVRQLWKSRDQTQSLMAILAHWPIPVTGIMSPMADAQSVLTIWSASIPKITAMTRTVAAPPLPLCTPPGIQVLRFHQFHIARNPEKCPVRGWFLETNTYVKAWDSNNNGR